MTKLQWGILGTGNIAATLAQALAQSTTSELLAVGSRSLVSAQGFATEHSCAKAYGSYEEVLADPDVQAIYISLPNHLHAAWTIRCAEASKQILCEKPLATNRAEAMAMLDAVRRHDVFFMEAFMYRCHPQTARVVQLVKAGAIGQVRMIQGHFSYNMGGEKLDNIRQQNEAAGGGIMDVGCYPMSLARLIAGAANGQEYSDPLEVKGVAHLGPNSRVDEWATAALRFPGDVLANLTCGTQVGVDSTFRIWGSAGNITIPNPWFPGRDGSAATFTLQRDGQEPEEISVGAEAPLYTIEVNVLARCLEKGEYQAPAPCMTWEDSLGNQAALDAWRAEANLVFDREKPDAFAPVADRPLQARASHSMRYGQIEGVGKPVSRVVMGSMVIHDGQIPFSFALLDNFFEQGGNCIDTAWVYGGGGSAERGVGKWIAQRDVRKQIVLIGKGAGSADCTPDMVTQQMQDSLERLDVDYLDLYLMHRDNLQAPVAEFVDCLNEHKNAGRIRAFGGSNWTTERLEAANEYAASKGFTGFAASSPNFSLAQWNEPMWPDCVSASDHATRAWYEKTQMPLFAWSSQASGFFTGRFTPSDRDNAQASEVVRVWFNDDNFRRLERAQELAAQKGVSALQIALAYVLAQPLNIFALIGPRTLEETRTSLAALEVQLSPEELRWLNLED